MRGGYCILRVLNVLAGMSRLLCMAMVGLWATSYSRVEARKAQLAPGGYCFFNWRGQLVFAHSSVTNSVAVAHFYNSLKGTAPTQGGAGVFNELAVLIKFIIFSPTASSNSPPSAGAVISRPYLLVTLAEGLTLRSGGGFGFTMVRVPTAGLTPAQQESIRKLGSVFQAVVVPDWFIVILTFVLPGRWVRRLHRKRKWIRRGCCGECGYDLRASPDICPECGTAVAVDQGTIFNSGGPLR
jgi:hypothetical protein